MSHMGARAEVPWERYRHTLGSSGNQTWTAGLKVQRASHVTTGTALISAILSLQKMLTPTKVHSQNCDAYRNWILDGMFLSWLSTCYLDKLNYNHSYREETTLDVDNTIMSTGKRHKFMLIYLQHEVYCVIEIQQTTTEMFD